MNIGLPHTCLKRGPRAAKESALPLGLIDPPPSGKRADGVRRRIQGGSLRNPSSAQTKVAGLLLNAQEEERTRIARELHDDIGQTIALFGAELRRTALLLEGTSKEGDAQLKELQDKIRSLGHRVSTLSHQLHSSELEFLGLAAAVKGLCRDFSEQYGIQVVYRCMAVSRGLNTDIELNFFRLLQEALRNVVKHSHADKVEVVLYETDGCLCLKFVDDGEGFDTHQPCETPGLGLTSMRERMCLLGGSFEIRSKREIGTRIDARVPLCHVRRIHRC
jgi:signal transduction histidine kinase